METKPFSMQSPEQIAKDYGGNKQKIAEAMQMGILDPTAGTMAGMFIDRMRSAAQMEAAPQQSVAQQVFAPPAPPQPPMGAPAGLGATPEAMAMPPQDMGMAPPMGMPPQEMAPQGEMPMMAEGGMIPPYAAGGGLSELPLPDTMFDEPSNGGFNDGYAGGGLVAFAAGDMVDEDGDGNPDTYFGMNYKNPLANAARDAELFGVPESKYASEYEADLLARRTPEARGKRRKEDMWMALGQIGARMAQTPGSIFQAAAAGIEGALPGIAASAKERKAEEREIQRGLIDIEQGRNTAAAQKAGRLLQMYQMGVQGRESQIGREFQKESQLAQFAQQSKEGALDRAVQMFGYSQRGRGGGSGGSGGASEGKTLSPAQATERIEKLGKQMDALALAAKTADDKKDYTGTQRKLEEWAAVRRAYNNIAENSGYAPVGTFSKRLPNFERNYRESGKQLPSSPQRAKPTASKSSIPADIAKQYGL